jgi:hypothetical protein
MIAALSRHGQTVSEPQCSLVVVVAPGSRVERALALVDLTWSSRCSLPRRRQSEPWSEHRLKRWARPIRFGLPRALAVQSGRLHTEPVTHVIRVGSGFARRYGAPARAARRPAGLGPGAFRSGCRARYRPRRRDLDEPSSNGDRNPHGVGRQHSNQASQRYVAAAAATLRPRARLSAPTAVARSRQESAISRPRPRQWLAVTRAGSRGGRSSGTRTTAQIANTCAAMRRGRQGNAAVAVSDRAPGLMRNLRWDPAGQKAEHLEC